MEEQVQTVKELLIYFCLFMSKVQYNRFGCSSSTAPVPCQKLVYFIRNIWNIGSFPRNSTLKSWIWLYLFILTFRWFWGKKFAEHIYDWISLNFLFLSFNHFPNTFKFEVISNVKIILYFRSHSPHLDQKLSNLTIWYVFLEIVDDIGCQPTITKHFVFDFSILEHWYFTNFLENMHSNVLFVVDHSSYFLNNLTFVLVVIVFKPFHHSLQFLCLLFIDDGGQ